MIKRLLINKYNFDKKLLRTTVNDYLILTFLVILTIIYSKMNIVYAMDHGKDALDVVNAIREHNIEEAQRILTILQQRNLTPTQMEEVHNIMARALEVRGGVNEYGVHNLQLQNAGIPETTTTRDLVTPIVLFTIFTITGYVIFSNWATICEFLFDIGTRAPTQITRATLIHTYEQVRNDPTVIRELGIYLTRTLIEE